MIRLPVDILSIDLLYSSVERLREFNAFRPGMFVLIDIVMLPPCSQKR